MKINVAKKKFLLCFRPATIIDTEPIGLADNATNNQHPRRKVSFPKTTTPHENDHKRSLSHFLKNLLLANALTKRIRKRRRSAKNSESAPVTKLEPQTKWDKDKKNNVQTLTTTSVDAKIEDGVLRLSPTSTSLYSDNMTPPHPHPHPQETNQNHGGDGGGCFKVVEQEIRGVRRPQMSCCRRSMVIIKRRLIRAVTHRYVIYAVLAVFGVAVFWRFNGVFLTCVWLYLAGDPLFSSSADHRQPISRRRTR